MRRIQPPTLSRLIMLGFAVVALPLVVGIVTAITQVDRLARDARESLVSVQQVASISRSLADRVTQLERSARQYQALGDSAYKDLYDENRHEVLAMFGQILEVNDQPEIATTLERAQRSEQYAHNLVNAIGQGSTAPQLEVAFTTLRDDVSAVVVAHNALARELANAMPTKAGSLQNLLLVQAILVIPLSVGLAVLFAVLITRPVRQIDHGIRSLGRGALSEPLQVRGTQDLEELGQRLDWLRVRLLELEVQKAAFLRNVSHELKTPLTNIREAAELLLTDHDRIETQTITQILRDNSVRLQKMIETLLRYGADGGLTPEQMTESVQFEQLIDDVLERQRLALTARSIALKTAIQPVAVKGDSKRLRVIVDNLLSNAAKHTPNGGNIRIALQASEGIIKLDVHDNGPGVHEQDAPHLFDWFYTGARPPESVVAGTGMGLAIAQEYAQLHNGIIELLPSQSGAHFRLTLPENRNV